MQRLAVLIAVLVLMAVSQAGANEVMTDRCSASVSFPTGYGGGPTSDGAVIIDRRSDTLGQWSPPFRVSLSNDGHIRWWCNSTRGNVMDPATWIRDVDPKKLFACIVAIGTAIAESDAAAAAKCENPFTFGSSVVDGWTPERSRCNNRSTVVRGRLGSNRLLNIECLGKTMTSTSAAALTTAGAASSGMEDDTDRPGSDIRRIVMNALDPAACERACRGDGACRSWTYVRPGVQAAQPICYLKGGIPSARRNGCCISGVKGGAVVGAGMAVGIDRPGRDYRNFTLPANDPSLCQRACVRESQCVAWTFVRPGVQGSGARCWLKNAVPREVRNDCCVSGTKR